MTRLGSVGAAAICVLLIASLYLPMLSARFDFADDGNLVYPAPPMALANRVGFWWQKVVANYNDLGPFRPVLWTHWELQAELLGARELPWRIWRLGWMMLAIAALLWFLRELGMAPIAAVLVTALAFWTPAPTEIWRSLTLSEGVAMPYAVGALICALRGGRSRRYAWAWDIAAIAGTLAALGCKNTFAAIIPAQVLLRLAPDGEPLAEAVRQRGRRAALLAIPLVLPIVHYIVFRLGWHAGQYESGAPSWLQLRRMAGTVAAGMSAIFIAPALMVALAALTAAQSQARMHRWWQACVAAARQVWNRHRTAARAGVALVVCGIGIYLPVRVSGDRYAIPAVWGAYLLIAALLTEVTRLDRRRPVAVGAVFAIGLVASAIANLLRQDDVIARSALLWNALEVVERDAPPGTAIAWEIGRDLGVGEGIHFYWHLHARGRGDIDLLLLAPNGDVMRYAEVRPTTKTPTLRVTGVAPSTNGAGWTLQRTFSRSSRAGWRQHGCALWTREPQAMHD